jgi:hypothetical protein
MRTLRNLLFLGLLGLVLVGRQQPVQARWDCNWDGICDAEEMNIYYMCGDCGNTYCTGQCGSIWDEWWCEVLCWGTWGTDVEYYYCDGDTGHQSCDRECWCYPPI